ncbi:MAG: hypothetical protein ACE5ED_09460 [Rhodothalassiaceae bacterium]
MDLNSFIIYLHELRNQCLYTEAAFSVFNQSIEQKSTQGVLFAGQAVLTSASQVATILWPSRARARRRGEVLREKLGLPAEHGMADRRFVELWERGDEKLDDFIRETKGDRVLFDFVGSPRTLNIPDLKEDGVYRMYDTDNRIFIFRGIGYDLGNLSKAIAEIGRRADLLHRQIMQQVQAQQADGARTSPASDTATAAPATDAAPATAEDLPSPVAGDDAADAPAAEAKDAAKA